MNFIHLPWGEVRKLEVEMGRNTDHREENMKLLARKGTVNNRQMGRGGIKINVSGLEFKTYASTLERFPGHADFFDQFFDYFYNKVATKSRSYSLLPL